jgi:hypothetical protein
MPASYEPTGSQVVITGYYGYTRHKAKFSVFPVFLVLVL